MILIKVYFVRHTPTIHGYFWSGGTFYASEGNGWTFTAKWPWLECLIFLLVLSSSPASSLSSLARTPSVIFCHILATPFSLRSLWTAPTGTYSNFCQKFRSFRDCDTQSVESTYVNCIVQLQLQVLQFCKRAVKLLVWYGVGISVETRWNLRKTWQFNFKIGPRLSLGQSRVVHF